MILYGHLNEIIQVYENHHYVHFELLPWSLLDWLTLAVVSVTLLELELFINLFKQALNIIF